MEREAAKAFQSLSFSDWVNNYVQGENYFPMDDLSDNFSSLYIIDEERPPSNIENNTEGAMDARAKQKLNQAPKEF